MLHMLARIDTAEHPRVRGENFGFHPRVRRSIGTSPRARGKHLQRTRMQLTKLEHPRARGENKAFSEIIGPQNGTSPRTRGKQIPYLSIGSVSPEHPRARGENRPRQLESHHRGGTSPRTRGKLEALDNIAPHLRNIPAHAGKTGGRPWWRTRW